MDANLDGKSLDICTDKLERLKEVFPEIFTEGKLDWERLRETLGEATASGNERYVLNWAGKADAFRAIQTPSTATLTPDRAESVNFDSSENIFIEGENLEALKILQKSYYGKVKMIYIDPPYNTGNDSFVYPDKFSESREDYLKRIGDKDAEGNLLRQGVFQKNSKDSGHYHSNWLSMMYPRLFLARNLLREDGVIFVSIDDNEAHNLRLLMNEIFGEESFIAVFPWRKRTAKSDVPFGVSQDFEWVIAYTKINFQAGRPIERAYHHSDDYGEGWRLADLTKQSTQSERPNSFFPLINPRDGRSYTPSPNRVWGVSKDTWKSYYEKGKIVFPGDYDFLKITRPAYRVFESEDREKNTAKFGTEEARSSVSTLLPESVGRTEDGTKEILDLFKGKVFPFPKPTSLLEYLASLVPEKDFIALDFFAGSASFAQALQQLNQKDGGNRRYLCIQFPEATDPNSEAYEKGYKTISAIARERIRRAIRAIDPKDKFRLGYKAFTITHSNFKLWRSDGIANQATLEQQLDLLTDAAPENGDEEAILFELMLKQGFELTAPIEKRNAEKQHYYLVDGSMAAAIRHLSPAIIADMLAAAPHFVVCLDSLFGQNDALKANTQLQFKDAGIEFRSI